MKKRLIKPITQSGIYQPELKYDGVLPIEIDNTQKTISLQQSFIDKANESVNETKVNEIINSKDYATNTKVNELNEQVKINKTNIETNKNDILNLKTSKQNKLIPGTNISIEGDTINSTYVYDDTPIKADIATKQNKINDILNVYEGEIKVFRTKTLALNFANFWGLKENIDYVVGINGSYVVIGENGNLGGSNLLKASDLPNFSIPVKNNYGSQLTMTESPSGSAVASLFAYSGNGKNNRVVYAENINNSQTEFKPKYTEVFAVVFLKKIFIIK